MRISIQDNKDDSGKHAAWKGASLINEAISRQGYANIIVATGASQFEMLDELVQSSVDWTKVTAFHLDEYIGLPATHPASFRKYLKERFVERINLKAFHYVNAETDPEGECTRLGELITGHPVDVAFIGIGENGHLAFNDPPADFDTEVPYLVVELDEVCRRQQLGEGWFPSFEDVPETAISMSVRQIMKSDAIICTVSEERKAAAVKGCVEGKLSPDLPASILAEHANVSLYLDREAASKLEKQTPHL